MLPKPGETRRLSELGLVSRRFVLKAEAGAVAGAGLAATVGAQPASARTKKLAKANATQRGLFTGPDQTGRFAAPYTATAYSPRVGCLAPNYRRITTR